MKLTPEEKAARKTLLMREMGERVRYWRSQRKMTRRALAARMGIDAGSVTRIEKGEQSIDLPPLIELCRALKITSDLLLLGEGPPHAVEPAPVEEQDGRRNRKRAG